MTFLFGKKVVCDGLIIDLIDYWPVRLVLKPADKSAEAVLL